jgi:predicted transcriptional regulator
MGVLVGTNVCGIVSSPELRPGPLGFWKKYYRVVSSVRTKIDVGGCIKYRQAARLEMRDTCPTLFRLRERDIEWRRLEGERVAVDCEKLSSVPISNLELGCLYISPR